MLQKISEIDEMRLTRAIEKAAALASVNTDTDRSTLLASQLKGSNVGSEFAKTAAALFNKRLTVLTFQKTADLHKGDEFQLADPARVYELMGGEPELSKEASADSMFSISFEQKHPEMKKAASASKAPRKNWEEGKTSYQVIRHVRSVMDKCASDFRELDNEINSVEAIYNASKETAERLLKQAGAESFAAMNVLSLYGDRLEGLLKDCISDSLTKSASTIRPDGELYDAVEDMLDARDSLDVLGVCKKAYVDAVSDIYAGSVLYKMAADLNPGVDYSQLSQQDIEDLRARMERSNEILNRLDSNHNNEGLRRAMSVIGPLAGHGVNATVTGMADLGNFGFAAMNDVNNIATDKLNTALGLIQAAKGAPPNPADVLEADFIAKDRLGDRMLAFSDMLADRGLIRFGVRPVLTATQSSMNSDLSLEQPSNRELLRAVVAQRLLQNNNIGLADIAQLATINKDRGEVRKNDFNNLQNIASSIRAANQGSSNPAIPTITVSDTKELKGLGKPNIAQNLKDLVTALEAADANNKADDKKKAEKHRDELINRLREKYTSVEKEINTNTRAVNTEAEAAARTAIDNQLSQGIPNGRPPINSAGNINLLAIGNPTLNRGMVNPATGAALPPRIDRGAVSQWLHAQGISASDVRQILQSNPVEIPFDSFISYVNNSNVLSGVPQNVKTYGDAINFLTEENKKSDAIINGRRLSF